MKHRIVASAVIEDGDRLLFGKRTAGKGPYPDTFHLLGGGIDLEKETVEEGLRREIREEAGIELVELQQLFFDEDIEPNKQQERTRYLFLVFRARAKGTPRAGDDIKELHWFSKKELAAVSLARPTVKLFKRMGYLSV